MIIHEFVCQTVHETDEGQSGETAVWRRRRGVLWKTHITYERSIVGIFFIILHKYQNITCIYLDNNANKQVLNVSLILYNLLFAIKFEIKIYNFAYYIICVYVYYIRSIFVLHDIINRIFSKILLQLQI